MWSLRMQIVTFRLHTAGLLQSITSIMQLKCRDPRPQRPHHEKNDYYFSFESVIYHNDEPQRILR